MTRLLGGLLIAASVALLPGEAVATPRLAPSRVLSPHGTPVAKPTVAVSGDGRTLVAWDTPTGSDRSIQHGRIEVRLGRVGHAWRPTQILSNNGESPITAIGANGIAAVAWSKLDKGEGHEGRTSIYVSIATPGHQFGNARLVVTGTRVTDPEGLEVQPGERVVLLWSRELPPGAGAAQRKAVDFATLGSAASPLLVGTLAVAGYGSLSVAQTEDGRVLVSFPTMLNSPPAGATPTSPVNQQAAVAMLPPDASAFTQPQLIEAEPGNFYASIGYAELSAGPGGAALSFANKVLELQPDGLFGSPVEVKESPQELAEAEAVDREAAEPEPTTGRIGCCGVHVALPADGALVVAGTRTRYVPFDEGEDRATWRRAMWAVRLPSASAFEYPVRISVGAGLSTTPRIATAGQATFVVWTQDLSRACKQRVYAAVRPGGGVFSAPLALSGTYVVTDEVETDECSLGDGQLSLAGSDHYAIAAWVQQGMLHVTTLTG